MSEGVTATSMPHSLKTAILAAAVSSAPPMTAPAWPMRRPAGAVAPAMKPATGFWQLALIGEIGGNAEVEAARWIKANCKKPVAGFIAGATAPAGRRMGHAGAVVGGAEDTAAAKIAVFQECGIEVAITPSDMADALIRAAQAKGAKLA